VKHSKNSKKKFKKKRKENKDLICNKCMEPIIIDLKKYLMKNVRRRVRCPYCNHIQIIRK